MPGTASRRPETLGQSSPPASPRSVTLLSNRVDSRPTSQARSRALPAPDTEDLLRVLLAVGRGGDDEQAVQQVDGDAVGALVAGAPDAGEAGEGKLSGRRCQNLCSIHSAPSSAAHSLDQIPQPLAPSRRQRPPASMRRRAWLV